jgi:succinoglycan biosynthesis transport protein ExoP
VEEPQSLDGVDLGRWLRVLRRRWWVIAACFILVAGSAAAFSLTRQKQYTATASVLFNESQLGFDLLGLPTTSGDAQPAIQADNVRLVQSSQVAALVSTALGGSLSPAQITRKVSASAAGTSDVVAIKAQDTSPAFAARLANLYAQQAIAFATFTDRSNVLQVRDSLQSQLSLMTPAQRKSPAGVALQARISQLNTLAAAQTGNAQLIELASVPGSPSYPKTKLDIVLGGCLGLLLGIGLALLLERLNRQVRVEELSRIYGHPVLAAVPESDDLQQDKAGAMDADGHNSIDVLRGRLRYFNVDGQMGSLLVTSCMPQEGKTTIAWHLARASALSTHGRVLLLEADLRRPSLATARGLQAGPGLSDVLAGDCRIDDAIQGVAVAPSRNGSGSDRLLDVIVAGPVPPNPAELIESERMKELISELTRAYDYMVVDSAPALVLPDPLALMSQVAGVLVVCRVGSTTRDAAEQLYEVLRSVRAPVVGVVANRVKKSLEASYYYGRVPPNPASTRSGTGAPEIRLPSPLEGGSLVAERDLNAGTAKVDGDRGVV